MNLFNRIVLVLLCLAVASGALAIIALAWTIPLETLDWLRGAADWLEARNENLEKTLLSTASAFVALIAFIVIIIELMPRSGPDVKVTDLKGANAVLSTAAIGQRIEEAVSRVPHVSEVRAAVKAKRKGVILGLELYVDPEANVADVTDEAVNAAQDVLANRVHVALLKPPKVRLHYRELRLRGGAQALPRRPLRTSGQPPEPPPPIAPPPETPSSSGTPAHWSQPGAAAPSADATTSPAPAAAAVATQEPVEAETLRPPPEAATATIDRPQPDGEEPPQKA
jgi:hypothetical protein